LSLRECWAEQMGKEGNEGKERKEKIRLKLKWKHKWIRNDELPVSETELNHDAKSLYYALNSLLE